MEEKTNNKQNISFSFKWRDVVILIVAVAITVASAFAAYHRPQNQEHLSISAPDGDYVYPLNKNRTVEVQGQMGISVIEIIDGSARFLSSPCDNKFCVSHGLLNGSFDFAACLPNGIFIMIEGAEDEEFDAVAQ